MNFEIDREDKARRANRDDDAQGTGGKGRSSKKPQGHGKSAAGSGKAGAPAKDIGETLKTVYQRTVSEDIPPEMLDLLGKLG